MDRSGLGGLSLLANTGSKTLKRINKLIKDIERNGNMEGIGKPEPLQYDLAGYFSRRIDETNSLVYVADENGLNIISCRYHYYETYGERNRYSI